MNRRKEKGKNFSHMKTREGNLPVMVPGLAEQINANMGKRTTREYGPSTTRLLTG